MSEVPNANSANEPSSAPSGTSTSAAASPRRQAIVFGTLALFVGTVYAALQGPQPAPLQGTRITAFDWWWYPVERNAVARLTVAGGPLRAVAASSTSDSVWFAGDGGLVIMSANGGGRWQSQNLSAKQQVVAAPKASAKDDDASAALPNTGTPFALVSNRQQSPVQQAPAYRVPSVVGLNTGSAEKALLSAGLKLGRVDTTTDPSSPARAGTIVQQSVAAGSPVTAGTVVNVVILSQVRQQNQNPVQQSPIQSQVPNAPANNAVAPNPNVTPPVDSTQFYPRFAAICLVASRDGWVAGDHGALFRTTDGGATWAQLTTNTRADLTSVTCSDSAGVVVSGSGGVTLNVAKDGSVNRVAGQRDPAVACKATTLRQHVSVPGRASLGVDSTGRVWSSTDAWQNCTSHALLVSASSPRVAAGKGSMWYAVADGAFRSNDEGVTWTPIVSSAGFTAVGFHDASTGWAGLEGGVVAHTTNGGKTWEASTVDPQFVGAVRQLMAIGEEDVQAVTDRSVYRSVDGGNSWRRVGATDSVFVPALYVDSVHWWGLQGTTAYYTADAGRTWSRDSAGRFRRADLNKRPRAAAPVNGRFVYGIAANGSVAQSPDNGRSWTPITFSPRKYPAPLFYPFALICVVGTVIAAWTLRSKPSEELSIADILVSDRPLRKGDRDVLNFAKIAGGLSRFLRNSRTEPPLTIAISGEWGSGKSSLMNLLRSDLEGHRFRTVWFNAWHHQREESLLAALLESIRRTATPPLWTLTGIRFRLRLLGMRFSRYSVPLIVLVPIFAVAMGYILHAPAARLRDLSSAFWSVVNYFRSGTGTATATTAGTPRTILALIVSVIGTVVTYVKGIKAFGVKPADLAKTVASAASVRSTDAQPGFRYLFAQDFGEVTDALKPERLVIFVDDLDRCQPEQVLEILESINFLVDSGDCIVVLGIDRKRVTGCVAIGFEKVANVLTEMDQGVLEQQGVNYKVQYAKHYLEKLLNMEIPIPPATAKDVGEVMTKGSTSDGEPQRIEQRLGLKRPLLAAAMLLLTFGAFGAGWRAAAGFRHDATPQVAQVGDVAAGASALPDTATAKLGGVTPSDSADVAGMSFSALPLLPVIPQSTAWWINVLVAGLSAAVLTWLVVPSEDRSIQDSAAFAKALRAWAPVLFKELHTPRAGKKFVNHVRFLSMVERAPAPKRAPVERAVGAIKRWPVIRRIVSIMRDAPHDEDEEQLLPEGIPGVALVSLSVIAKRYPKWLDDDQFWTTDLRQYVEGKVKPVPPDIEESLKALAGLPVEQHFAYKDEWAKLRAWVQTEDASTIAI